MVTRAPKLRVAIKQVRVCTTTGRCRAAGGNRAVRPI